MAVRAQRTKLSRERDQRRALIKSLAESLIMHESIVTTDTKARALRPHVEKLITKAGKGTLASKRLVKSKVNTDEAAEKLIDELAPRYKNRPGGYTRLSAAGWRRGDNAKMTRISFVEEATSEGKSEKPAEKSDDAKPKETPGKNSNEKTSAATSKTKQAKEAK